MAGTSPLEAGDMWASEHAPRYGVCGYEATPAADPSEAAAADLPGYARLVPRDGGSVVQLQDRPKRSRGPLLWRSFHAIVAWPYWRIMVFCLLSCIVVWLLIGVIYHVLRTNNLVGLVDEAPGLPSDEYSDRDTFFASFLLVSYTATTVGFGAYYPTDKRGYWGSAVCFLAYFAQLFITGSWVAIMMVKAGMARPLQHTVLFSNRAVLKRRDPEGACFQSRLINLRTKHPWLEVRVRLFYSSWSGGRHSMVPLALELFSADSLRGKVDCSSQLTAPLFMDLPVYVTHRITEQSPLDELSPERMTEERGELVVELEGYDPLTGGPIKRRFSYVAAELFVDHEFSSVLEQDPDGGYRVNLDRFHRTYEVDPSEEHVYATSDQQGWARQGVHYAL